MRAQHGELRWLGELLKSGVPVSTTFSRGEGNIKCSFSETDVYASLIVLHLFSGTFGHQYLWARLERGWTDSGCDN